MDKLRFAVSDHHLAYAVYLTGKDKDFPGLLDLRNSLRVEFGDFSGYAIFTLEPESSIFDFTQSTSKTISATTILRDADTIISIFDRIFVSPFFCEARLDATKYMNDLRENWNSNEAQIFETLSLLTSFSMPAQADVYVLDPKLNTASYIHDNKIEIGLNDHSIRVSSVILAHELMHYWIAKSGRTFNDPELWVIHALIFINTNERLQAHLDRTESLATENSQSEIDPRICALVPIVRRFWDRWRLHHTPDIIAFILDEQVRKDLRLS